MPFWSSWKILAPSLVPDAAAADQPRIDPGGQFGLDRAVVGRACRVLGVKAPDGAPDWGRWLAEIGFLPGENVKVTARNVWGGDPLVVRIGESTFALRRAEAACVQVEFL